MKNSYVYQVISSLDTKEQAQLQAFLNSPYFNTGRTADHVIKLYDVITYPRASVTKEDVFLDVFPSQTFSSGKLDKLMSELNKLVSKFFMVQKYFDKKNAFKRALDTAQILRERNLMDRYPRAIKQAEKILGQEKESVNYYVNNFDLAFEKHIHESYENRIKGDLAIPQTMEALDRSYIARRFELLNLLLLQQKIVNLEIPSTVLEVSLERFLQTHNHSDYPLLKISGKINEQLRQPKPAYSAIQEIIQLLSKTEANIDRETLNNYYTYLRNICTMLIREGESLTLKLLHEIHVNNLENGLLFHQGKLLTSTYLNVAKVAISTGQPAWALDFVEKHQADILTSEDPHPYYQFNKAICLFALKKYEESLDILPASFTDMQYMLGLRRLELKIYYELDASLLPYKIDAQKMYISRIAKKLISNDAREIEGNFINILLQIHQCPPYDKNRIAKIVTRVQEKKLIAEKDWLLEKLRELKV